MRTTWVPVLILLATCSMSEAEPPSGGKSLEVIAPTSPNDRDPHAEEALDNLRFDRVNFVHATWKDVADFFMAEYLKGTDTYRPVYIKLDAPSSKKISLSMSNVPCRVLLESACQQTGSYYAVSGEAVVILPDEAARKHYLAEANFRLRLMSIIIPKFTQEPINGTNIDFILRYLATETKRADPTNRGITFVSNVPAHWHEDKATGQRGPIHNECGNYGEFPLFDILNIMIASGLECSTDPERNTVTLSVPGEERPPAPH